MDKSKTDTRDVIHELLISEGFYRESVIIAWIDTRSIIFNYLLKNNIRYTNTREALSKIMEKFNDGKISSDIWFLETISTLCEWDNTLGISMEQSIEFRNICNHVTKKISYGR